MLTLSAHKKRKTIMPEIGPTYKQLLPFCPAFTIHPLCLNFCPGLFQWKFPACCQGSSFSIVRSNLGVNFGFLGNRQSLKSCPLGTLVSPLFIQFSASLSTDQIDVYGIFVASCKTRNGPVSFLHTLCASLHIFLFILAFRKFQPKPDFNLSHNGKHAYHNK